MDGCGLGLDLRKIWVRTSVMDQNKRDGSEQALWIVVDGIVGESRWIRADLSNLGCMCESPGG